VKQVRIYFEGDRGLRRGFHKFFGSDGRIEVIAGRGGGQAKRDFMLAAKTNPDALVLLLLDAEGPLPPGPRANNTFYMVQLMESWFLADRDTLAAYFGPQDFQANALPRASKSVESILKRDVLRGLDSATKQCFNGTGKYSDGKVKHAGELMGPIDSVKVRKASKECQRLFDALSL
jgi:hypothetical protein